MGPGVRKGFSIEAPIRQIDQLPTLLKLMHVEIPGTVEGKAVQFLKKLKVHEVSPVLLGAGIGTQTLSVKSLSDMTDDQLAEETERVCLALKTRGLPVPPAVTAYVRETDDAEAELKSRNGMLHFIAAINGINTEGEVA